MASYLSVHKDVDETLRKVVVSPCRYETKYATDEIYVCIEVGQRNRISLHGMTPTNVAELASGTAEALAQLNEWNRIESTGKPAESTEGIELADQASEATGVDVQRVERLVKTAEKMLLFLKYIMVPPKSAPTSDADALFHWEETEALKLIREVEPHFSEGLVAAKMQIHSELITRGAATFNIVETGATD
jgi:hypothetical protein